MPTRRALTATTTNAQHAGRALGPAATRAVVAAVAIAALALAVVFVALGSDSSPAGSVAPGRTSASYAERQYVGGHSEPRQSGVGGEHQAAAPNDGSDHPGARP